MIGLTLLVIAMIASYSGAFAKPTLHHMTVAIAAPEQVVNGIRGQEALAVNEVGDDAAARRQVYERKSDAAFVVSPTGEMKIYVAGGGGRSVANAAETVGRAVAAEAGLTPAVEDVAPASAGDPSGTVEFYAIIFISIGASVGATMLGRLMGTIRRPPTLALRSATLAGYSALLSVAVTVYVDVILGALTAHTWQLFGALSLYGMAVGGVVTGAGRGIRLGRISMGLTAFLYSTFTAIVPQGSDVSLLRSLSYFGGNGAQTPLVTMVIWGAAGCLLAIVVTASRVNYPAIYERFLPGSAGRDRAVLRPGLLSPAD